MKGWHINVEGAYKKDKKTLLEDMGSIDKKGKRNTLSVQEKEVHASMHIRLKTLLKDEELKWRQRSKEKYFKEGDGNDNYFHLKGSGRKKKNHIVLLQHNGEEILGEADLITHVNDF
jgi:hypothetical protein